MKAKLLIAVTLVLFTTIGFAQQEQDYKVTAKTFLNVRSNPQTDAPIIGTIDKGGKVSVYEIEGDWAKIAYQGDSGYVSVKYITPVVNQNQKKKSNYSEHFSLFGYELRPLHLPGVGRTFVYFILGLSVILFIIRLIRRDDPLDGIFYPINWILFLLVSVMEIIYVISLSTESIWFCMPGEVGWLCTVINFLLFGFVVYNQLMCLLNTVEDIRYNSDVDFDLRWGVYSWPIAIVAMIICVFFYQSGIPVVGILLVIVQIVQLVIICKDVISSYGKWGDAILCAVVYLLGSVATVLILIHFLVLLVIVLIGFFILYIIGLSSTKEDNQRCSNCRYYSGKSSGSRCSYRDETIYNPDTTSCNDHR